MTLFPNEIPFWGTGVGTSTYKFWRDTIQLITANENGKLYVFVFGYMSIEKGVQRYTVYTNS